MNPIEREHEVEQWLNVTLGQYGKAEPRAGLEGRVLANLHAQQGRMASRRRWWWPLGLATALAAAMLFAVWIGESARERKSGSTVGTSMAHTDEPRVERPTEQAAEAGPLVRSFISRGAAKRRPASHDTRNDAADNSPKLAQFPSPQPLSEQERILLSYVANYPGHAAMVAQARSDALQRDHAEEMDVPASNYEGNSK